MYVLTRCIIRPLDRERTEEWMSSDSLMSFTSKHTLSSEERSSDRRTVCRNLSHLDAQAVPKMCHFLAFAAERACELGATSESLIHQ